MTQPPYTFVRPAGIIPIAGRNLLVRAAQTRTNKTQEIEAAIVAVKKLYPHLFRKDSQS